jgi:hypothetical protein
LNVQSLVTFSGINAVVEGVDEIIYPTEFDVSESDITLARLPLDGFSRTQYIVGQSIPGAFETREIGALLNVTPNVGPDNETISLQLLPELVELVDWIEYGDPAERTKDGVHQAPHQMRQPVFRSFNFTSSFSLRDGTTLSLGAGQDPKTGEYRYLYLHVQLVDLDGVPLR